MAQAIGLVLQGGESQRATATVFVLPGNGHLPRRGGLARPACAADLGDVEVLWHLPMQALVQKRVRVRLRGGS